MTDPKLPALPRQLMMTFDSARLRGMTAAERAAAVAALASLLIQAAKQGGSDDE
jgi:hypothetical protein